MGDEAEARRASVLYLLYCTFHPLRKDRKAESLSGGRLGWLLGARRLFPGTMQGTTQSNSENQGAIACLTNRRLSSVGRSAQLGVNARVP